jgi:hypothetical protein
MFTGLRFYCFRRIATGDAGKCCRIGRRAASVLLCLLWFLVSCLVPKCDEAHAAPETWFSPVLTEVGNTSSSFGSAVACSAPDSVAGHSWLAVGAPDESAGQGRVYILSPTGIIDTLQSNAPGGGKQFGAAVAFIADINGDSISELAVGEPHPSGANGSVQVFLSTGNAADPFEFCTALSGTVSFGSHIFATSLLIANSAQIVISSPLAAVPAIESHAVTYDSMTGLCQFTADSAYGSTGDPNSRYGQSVAEFDDGSLNPSLLIGAPGNTDGGVYVEQEAGGATLTLSGSSGGNLGAGIAASSSSALLAFLAPRQTNSVSVQSQSLGAFMPRCNVQVPMSSLSTSASHALAHLGSAFVSFIGEIDYGVSSEAVFASYRDEADTGGSIVLFGAHTLSNCSALKRVNNCVFDSNQKQGTALAGGALCEVTGGAKALLVGSPGFSNNKGRIDLYKEGTESIAAAPCAAPTNTPTSTPTSTATPSPTPTMTPIFGGLPIQVDPTTSTLPAPIIERRGTAVTLVAPRLVSSRFKFIGYFWTIIFRGTSRASEFVVNKDSLTRKSKRREIFSRRERITLRNLAPGRYTATYRPVFQATKSQKGRMLGKSSAQLTFISR